MQLNRAQLLANQLKLKNPRGDWADICRRIKDGTVVPIIGNALRNDGVFEWFFSPAGEKADEEQLNQTVDEYLSQAWAEKLGYPLLDTANLARVALYNRVISKDDEEAKVNYLLFLKGILMAVACNDPQVKDRVGELEPQIEQRTFSDLVVELDYPHLAPDQEDPLRILARMQLPVYITTSYYDFLERALEAEDRPPRTQICTWNGEPPGLKPEHKTVYDLEPTRENPIVYHLFGLEAYPSTMVLSEADYLDYLLRIISDVKSTSTNTTNPVIPHYLRAALYSSSLVLIGYRLQDWDFRVLFRLIRENDIPRYNVLVQVSPDQLARGLKSNEAREFLKEYFKDTFTLQWGGPEEFVYQLCAEYKKWTQAER